MTKSEEYYKKMTETPVAKLIVSLGIPTTISMLITNIYNLADTYFVGGLGETPQGATGILFTLQCIIQAIAFMLGHGSGTFVSKHLATRNIDGASKFVSSAFFLGISIGTLLMTGGLIFIKPFMYLLGSTDTILPYAVDYGMWVLISAPFIIGALVLNNNLRYEGKAFYAMIGLTSGGILNIFGDYLLIKVFEMGVFGAGLSTAVSQMISFILLFFMYQKNAQSHISLKFIAKDVKTYLDIMRVGFPSFIRQGLTSISNGLLNNLVKPHGDAAIATMSIINKYSGFVFCVGLGIGQGFQPVASYNYELKMYKRCKRGLLVTMFIGFGLVGILAGLGSLFAEPIIRVFQNSDEVVKIGVPALRYASVGVMFMPIVVSTNMLYQSIRKAGIASFLALMRSGMTMIPILVLLSSLLGLDGIIMSQPLADVVTGIITIPFTIMFLKKKESESVVK